MYRRRTAKYYTTATLLSGLLIVPWIVDAALAKPRAPSASYGVCQCSCVADSGANRVVASTDFTQTGCMARMGRDCKIQTTEGTITGEWKSCLWTWVDPSKGLLAQPPEGVVVPEPSEGKPEGALPTGGALQRQ
jgi:hypothetical protein